MSATSQDATEKPAAADAPAAEGPEAVAEETAEELTGNDYRVMQGPLFKKPGSDPTTQKVIKLTRKVGSKIKTTGKIWTGPSGGQWVELDPDAEKKGWLLIEGPGFNQPGPLLEHVRPGEEVPMVLYVLSPIDDSKLCEICVRSSDSIGVAKSWILYHMPGLVPRKIQVVQEKPSGKTHGMGLRNFPTKWMYEDRQKVSETPFKDGDEFVFFYLGEAAEDLREFNERMEEAKGKA
mmetsp:Transcript_47150/g.88331  ORF Transcript_47150/g.88331 Transcript_47150/m.88331 type:complete len:235 (+) Transcript_47150:153-857(+)